MRFGPEAQDVLRLYLSDSSIFVLLWVLTSSLGSSQGSKSDGHSSRFSTLTWYLLEERTLLLIAPRSFLDFVAFPWLELGYVSIAEPMDMFVGLSYWVSYLVPLQRILISLVRGVDPVYWYFKCSLDDSNIQLKLSSYGLNQSVYTLRAEHVTALSKGRSEWTW